MMNRSGIYVVVVLFLPVNLSIDKTEPSELEQK